MILKYYDMSLILLYDDEKVGGIMNVLYPYGGTEPVP